MNKAVFLDRDGTINVEKHYLHKIVDFEFLPGVIEGLKMLQDAGFLLVIITNQSGIGRGYYTEEDFHKLNNWMLQTLKDNGVNIAKVYYCPHLPDAKVVAYRKDCDCRKPKLGMYEQAIKDLDITLDGSYAIGDKIRDCAICNGTLCKGFLIAENERADIIEDVKKNRYDNVAYANDLLEAAVRMVDLYKLAYPSAYEGFGIPVLEAQRAGCPVIAFNASSIPEIIGDTPLLLDELSVPAFLDKLDILKDGEQRNKIISAGLENSKRYSWEKMGEEYVSLYKELLAKKGQ